MWSTPLDQVLRIRLVDMVAHSWVQQAPLSKDQVRPPLPPLTLPTARNLLPLPFWLGLSGNEQSVAQGSGVQSAR